jgi:hypothetical protein
MRVMILPLLVRKHSVETSLFRAQILAPGCADNTVLVWKVDCELQLAALDSCPRMSAPDVRT